MTGLPSSVVVKLDDGTGTYPIDISAQVEAQDSVTISSYGRGDEFATAQSAALALVLDNSDGSFTVGAGWDTGPWGYGPWGGVATALAPGQGIRVTETIGATTRDRFTGKVSELPLGWQGGSGTFSTIGLTAVDPLADAARKTLRSMLEQEILRSSPSAYYTLDEPAGSTTAGDSSGHQATSLGITGAGSAVVFGNGIGPGTDGLTAAQFAAGQYLSGAAVAGGAVPTTFTLGCWVATTTAAAVGTSEVLAASNGWSLKVNSSGQLLGSLLTSPTSITDGRTHFVAVSADGVTQSLWLDGVVVNSTPVSGASATDFTTSVGGGSAPAFLSSTATVSHVAIWTTGLSPADMTAIYNAGVGATESTAARLARIAAYGGLATATTTGMSGQLTGAQSTSGKTLADALNDVAAAEGGVLYVNGSGVVVLQGQGYRAQKVAADLSLTAVELGSDTVFTYDTQQKINQVTVTRTGGATQVVSSAAVLANPSEPVYPSSLDLPVDTDANALLRAQWIVGKHETPAPRLPSATFDLHKSSVGEQLFQREVGDRLAFTGMPAQLWAGSGDVTIEGWTETISNTSWTLTVNLLPWSLFQSGIYDDAGSLYDTAVYA